MYRGSNFITDDIMDFTFGIITSGNEHKRIIDIISSIRFELPYGSYEIIVVGGDQLISLGIKWYEFDETIKPNHITKKKNLVAQLATRENIVLMHDYVALQPGWFQGFERFGNDWLTCTNKIQNLDGSRFRDFCVIANDAWTDYKDSATPNFTGDGRLLDYSRKDYNGYVRWGYYSGAYFLAKRQVLLEVPLDEERVWSQGEDVKISRDIYFKYGAKALAFNPYATVKLLKQKERAPWENMPPI